MIYGGKLIAKKFDRRNDDEILTPKRGRSIEQQQLTILKQIKKTKNLTSEDPLDLSEDESTLNPGDDEKITKFPNYHINPIT